LLVKADVSLVGPKGNVSGTALVDTGASITLLDEEAADRIGARLVGRCTRLVVADGHEVSGELAIVDKLIIEGEELPGAHVVVLRFPSEIKERLKAHGLSDWCIVGLSALEILGLAANVAKGRVEKVGSFLLTAINTRSRSRRIC
jgi:predicted aspartyl protease